MPEGLYFTDDEEAPRIRGKTNEASFPFDSHDPGFVTTKRFLARPNTFKMGTIFGHGETKGDGLRKTAISTAEHFDVIDVSQRPQVKRQVSRPALLRAVIPQLSVANPVYSRVCHCSMSRRARMDGRLDFPHGTPIEGEHHEGDQPGQKTDEERHTRSW